VVSLTVSVIAGSLSLLFLYSNQVCLDVAALVLTMPTLILSFGKRWTQTGSDCRMCHPGAAAPDSPPPVASVDLSARLDALAAHRRSAGF
jgi:hypothetical protein